MELVPLTLLAGGTAAARLADQLVDDDPDVALVGSPGQLRAALDRGRRILVESDTASRTPGCNCCQVRLDLVGGVMRAVRRRHRPSRVIIVLDEDDDAVTAAYTVLADADLQRLVQLDGVIVTIDAVQLATRVHGNLAIDNDRGLDRLAFADRILVARGRDVTPTALGQIGHLLRSLNRIAPIIVPALTQCNLDEIVDIDAWHGAPRLAEQRAEPSTLLPGNGPQTITCASPHPLDPDLIDEWLDTLIAEHASRLMRLQGAVRVPEQHLHSCFHGIRSYAMNHAHPGMGRVPAAASNIVVIGRDLPTDELRSTFAAAQLRPS